MKALIVSLLFPVLLKSCDGSPDQIGRQPSPITNNPNPTPGTGTPTGTGATTDAPIDGGLSILLVAGVAYGAKRYRDSRMKAKDVKENNS